MVYSDGNKSVPPTQASSNIEPQASHEPEVSQTKEPEVEIGDSQW